MSYAAAEITEYVNVTVRAYMKLPGIMRHAGANAPCIAAYHQNCLISCRGRFLPDTLTSTLYPRWKDPPHKAQPCGAHQLRTPEGPVDSIGSHKKADGLLIMFSLYWISVTLDSAPFLFQNVFKDKGFIDKLEVAVSCHPKTIILVVYFFLYNNAFEIMDCSSEKISQVKISIKIRSRKSMKFRNYESFPISKISKQVLFNRFPNIKKNRIKRWKKINRK